jgi:hypothetical protein
MLRSKCRHKKCHSVFLGENPQKNIFGFGAGSALYIGIRKRELKMKKFRSYRSYSSSYRPYGSDDGYDYHKENRYGEVDAYVRFVEEWRKEQAEKKAQIPQNRD